MQLQRRRQLRAEQGERRPLPGRGLLCNPAGHGRLLFRGPVDLRRRPALLDRPRLLQQVLRGHVRRQALHEEVPQLHQHLEAASGGREVGNVLLRRHGEGL